MPGSVNGGKKAAATNKKRHGPNFYQRIGAVGGKKSRNGGFWYRKYVLDDVEFVRQAGAKGGKVSRRHAAG